MKNTSIDVSQHINKDEKILWRGTEEKLSYTKNASPMIIKLHIFCFLISLLLLGFATHLIISLMPNLKSGFETAMLFPILLSAFMIFISISAILSICRSRQTRYIYVITDKNIYLFSKNRKKKGNVEFIHLPVNRLNTIRLDIHKDETATITFNQPEVIYYYLNYRGMDTSRTISRVYPIVQFVNVKDYETACKCISEIMSSTK